MKGAAICAALSALALASCGGGGARAGTPGGGEPAETEGARSACEPAREVAHPRHTSSRLRLSFRQRGASHGIVMPPLEFEVETDEEIESPVEMELTIHDPDGRTHAQRFTYSNMVEACDPHCLPVRSRADCPPRRCWMERTRPRAQRIDPTVYASRAPGRWTFVLHRLDDGERTSVSMSLFEGPALSGEECEMLPVALGGFERAACRRGIVPLGGSTSHWGVSARYVRDGCRVNAFALPLAQHVRTAFFEGPYGEADLHALDEGTVRQVELEGGLIRAWLAHHHLYVLAARADLEGFDDVVGELLSLFPVVSGPIREVPSCRETGAVEARVVPPTTTEAIRDRQAGFHTHFEGNRPAGAWVRMNDLHPLALAGLRRGEIVQTVDGERVRDRRHLLELLEGLTREGRMELVVSRRRVRHPRCLKLTIDASAAPAEAVEVQPPPPPPPPPAATQAPRIGRHCERRSDRCWDCVEFPFPAEVGCTHGCRADQICVGLAGRDQCLDSIRVCCAGGQACDRPPGCAGAASSCASDVGGRNERCTFLSACQGPLPQP